jgi:hypothetical protein
VSSYSAGYVPVNMFVLAYGTPAGRILGYGGRYHAYDLTWSPIGSWSTERRALHGIGQHALLSMYGTYIDALLGELTRGLIALDQEPANVQRLMRCSESDIRNISTELLALGWSKNDLAKLIVKWRELREMAR